MIDSRHAIGRLKSLEEESLQATRDLFKDEQLILFADIFLSVSEPFFQSWRNAGEKGCGVILISYVSI